MKRRGDGFRELCRSLGTLVAAGLVVASIVGVFLNFTTVRVEDGRADRPGLQGGKAGADRAGNEARTARTGRRKPKGTPRIALKGGREEIVEVVEEEDEATSAMARPTAPGREPSPPPSSAALAEYEARKAKTTGTAEAQARLAKWCEGHDLKDQARDHWEAVTRLNPKNEMAWKHLGYKKRHDRWMTDAMIAEEEQRDQAERRWKAPLEALHKRLHAKGPDAKARRDEAEAELSRVDDPSAAHVLWRVFAGDAAHHLLLAGLLGGLESPGSSKMLAALAVYSRDAKARHAALDGLRGRDPVEFAEPLIALLARPLKHKTVFVPVPGQGQAKALEVEDERVNRLFIYQAPTGASSGADNAFGGCSANLGAINLTWTAEGRQIARALNDAEALRARYAADQQFEADVAAVEAINASIVERNGRVVAVLTATARVDHRDDREGWRRWLAQRQDRPYSPPSEVIRPTIAQLVPPLYSPSFINIPAPS